ncbi:MAG: hypothetical protein C5B56_05605 [Proteobacteria bacterium]|nr:MAG: hypothetical protein C5B56_05605 [Pseudomonadota bacterium]
MTQKEPVLLTTESRKEFVRFRKGFYDEIKPSQPTECHHVDWIVMLAWEVLRLRRTKAGLINCALPEALKNLLKQVLSSQRLSYSEREEAIEDLGARWFVDDAAKAEVAALLAKLGLDEASIEAEAYRLRAAEIESVDRLLTSKQQSLEKALRFIGKLRKKLGDRLRQRSAEHLEENAPPILVARFRKDAE